MHKSILTRPAFHPLVLLLCSALLLGGCASTKNAASRDAIAGLKTAHLAFIDEFTEGAGKTWDDQKLTTRTAAMDKQFADALQDPATVKDASRKRAVTNLQAQFKRNSGMLERKKAFFRPKFAAGLKDQLTQNYDQALRGEDIR